MKEKQLLEPPAAPCQSTV